MTVLTKLKLGIKGGYQNHPQILRFVGHEGMLISRHNEQVEEFKKRGYPSGFNHLSPIPRKFSELFKTEPYVYSDEEMKRDLETLKQRQGGKTPK